MTEESNELSEQLAEFRLWGDVGIFLGDERASSRTDKEKSLLACLLLARGKKVRRELVTEWMWDDDPPSSAQDDLSKYMGSLRKALDNVDLRGALISEGGMCQLKVPESRVDEHRFRKLVESSRSAELWDEARLLDLALRETEGLPLGGLMGQLAKNRRIELSEARFAAQLRSIELGIELGRHNHKIPELARLFDARPDHTAIVCLTMRAYHLAGRPQDVSTTVKRHLKHCDEFGLTPAKEVRNMQTRILKDDDSLRPQADRGEQPTSVDPVSSVDARLVMFLRPENDDPESLRPLLSDVFGRSDLQVEGDDERLICVVPADVPPTTVMGSWLDRLAQRLNDRVYAGVATDDEWHAEQLADSEFARLMLDTAHTKNLVVAISDDLYRLVSPHSLRAYRKDEGVDGGWVRIPGYSTAPRPGAEPPKRRRPPPAGPERDSTMVVNERSRIGRQIIGDTFNYGGAASDDS